MNKEIVGVEITNDGYRSLAGLFIVNVLDNVKSRKGWMKADACALIMEAIKIARQMDDVDYALLDSQIKKRYGVTRRQQVTHIIIDSTPEVWDNNGMCQLLGQQLVSSMYQTISNNKEVKYELSG